MLISGGGSKTLTSLYNNIGGTRKSISSAFANISGVQKQIHPCFITTPLSDLTIGSIVYMNLNDIPNPFIIIHKGTPTDYDNSCNGIWLLSNDIIDIGKWDTDNDTQYNGSMVHDDLTNIYFYYFDSTIQSIIKTVYIPYSSRRTYGNSVDYKSKSLSTKLFLLSIYEVGIASEDVSSAEPTTILDYFNGASASKRIAYRNGTASEWWLRTKTTPNDHIAYINTVGTDSAVKATTGLGNKGIRPALVLPSTQLVDSSFNVIA